MDDVNERIEEFRTFLNANPNTYSFARTKFNDMFPEPEPYRREAYITVKPDEAITVLDDLRCQTGPHMRLSTAQAVSETTGGTILRVTVEEVPQ